MLEMRKDCECRHKLFLRNLLHTASSRAMTWDFEYKEIIRASNPENVKIMDDKLYNGNM